MRSLRVVVHSPLFDHDLRLLQGVENLSIQTLVPQLPVEAFTVAVLPWASRLDVQCSFSHPSPATSEVPPQRTRTHCPNECVSGFHETASRPPVLRSLRTSLVASPHGSPDTPA